MFSGSLVKKQAEHLAATWRRQNEQFSERELLGYARQVVRGYSHHPDFLFKRLKVPLCSMLADVIQPQKGLLVEPPLNARALIERFWLNQCLDEEAFKGLQVVALQKLRLAKYLGARHLPTEPWQHNLLQKQTTSVREVSVCYFAATFIADALKISAQSDDFIKCLVMNVLTAKSNMFKQLRAWLNFIMANTEPVPSWYNLPTFKPTPRMTGKQVKRSMRMDGAFGLAVAEGNETLLQYLHDCIALHIKMFRKSEQPTRMLQVFKRIGSFEQLAAKKNRTAVLRTLAVIAEDIRNAAQV